MNPIPKSIGGARVMRRAIHLTAIVAVAFLAFRTVEGAIRVPLKGISTAEQFLHPILGIALWTFLISKLWKKPRTWGLGVGIFLLFLLAFQTYLWSLALAKPDHSELGMASTTFGFVVYEIPLAVGAVCSILLRWFHPDESPRHREPNA